MKHEIDCHSMCEKGHICSNRAHFFLFALFGASFSGFLFCGDCHGDFSSFFNVISPFSLKGGGETKKEKRESDGREESVTSYVWTGSFVCVDDSCVTWIKSDCKG